MGSKIIGSFGLLIVLVSLNGCSTIAGNMVYDSLTQPELTSEVSLGEVISTGLYQSGEQQIVDNPVSLLSVTDKNGAHFLSLKQEDPDGYTDYRPPNILLSRKYLEEYKAMLKLFVDANFETSADEVVLLGATHTEMRAVRIGFGQFTDSSGHPQLGIQYCIYGHCGPERWLRKHTFLSLDQEDAKELIAALDTYATGTPFEEAPRPDFELSPSDSDNALLYLYRLKSAPTALAIKFQLNGEDMEKELKVNDFVTVELSPGTHEIKSAESILFLAKNSSTSIDVQAGETYFLKFTAETEDLDWPTVGSALTGSSRRDFEDVSLKLEHNLIALDDLAFILGQSK